MDVTNKCVVCGREFVQGQHVFNEGQDGEVGYMYLVSDDPSFAGYPKGDYACGSVKEYGQLAVSDDYFMHAVRICGPDIQPPSAPIQVGPRKVSSEIIARAMILR